MLQYVWRAYYKDETKLDQFSEDKEEKLFKDIDQDKLKYFAINSVDNNHFVMVNLENGEIVIDNVPIKIEGMNDKKESYRLIHFRRVAKNMECSGKSITELNTIIRYFIGYQITIEEVNKQIMIEVNDKHEFKIHIK